MNKMSKTWVLVEWREEPPTYDIVPKKDILKKKFESGDVVDVAYEEESSPATVIDIDESKDTLRRRMFRLEGKRKNQPCLQNDAKRVAKKKKTYTPTQSPSHSKTSSSDQEPPVKHQVIHRKDSMLMQEINSMESQAEEHSSRETQLEREILKLKKENENLRALNIALQQEILPMLKCSMNQDTRLVAQQPQDSSQKNPPEKTQGLGISSAVLTSCGRGGTSCSAMVKDLAVAVFGRETLATHGLSGRAGNANTGTLAKPALDQDKVVMILDTVQKKFPDVPKKFIRAALREKLNDEHKLRVRKTV
ncbi:BEN domain-containing protein 6-like isoform X1 [Megalobrama amblycephala]|uniref:BEN domain-containing protein 6-like isoform X1 n=3 Tax=Megalobrama amblycephala TaxID=75352 RepID=UPI0020146809|nr:BEN domain-containing protein 6-like isoform X1 [Megalobrama amblycephala]XP_048015168.1 BEN domain-containing protein 6-like isoform X1 [Megalobrama amblycephala]XP_048049051.1 BEN domain-containing protein 6-like isoform X1 [Megalobrama amblycephala]XP_048051670.1 BEN domain-containing protein 6-like isoform X1 [Megalobrama amblycephala]